jgi:hypothetical protein
MPRIALALLLFGSLCATGCTMCQDCFDSAYPLYGGKAIRTDRSCGRVGSRFAPAGPDVGELSPYKRETDKGDLYSPGPAARPDRPETPPLPNPLETNNPSRADEFTR